MPTVKQILDLAESQVGTTEYPPNSNDVVYNTAFYGKEVSGSAYPWCCTFVWWVFAQFDPCLVKKTASCMEMAQWFKDNGKWGSTPHVGDVVFFKFDTNSRWTNHVGIVEEILDGGLKIKSIEGNTSLSSDNNGGAVMERIRSSNIVGYGHPAYSEDVPVNHDDDYEYGVDVSKYQGSIDWKAVKDSGISFAVLRILQNGSSCREQDPTFESNLKCCIENGIDYSCYVYAYATTHEQARLEADLVINLLKERKMTIWYDLEDKSIAPLGKDAIEGIALSFIGECKEAGFDVGIYCNKNWYDNYISDYLKKKFKFWIARYGKNTGYLDEKYKPTGRNVIAWQYTSKGIVDGIDGFVDRDVLY